MASIAKLVVSLGAKTSNFETDMKRASRITKREMAKMERQAKQLNAKWSRHFKMAGLAVAAGLGLAVKAAAEFENAMAEVSTLLDDTSGLDKTADAVKDLSVQFGQAPVSQAKALYQIISAGAADAATQMENLTAANRLAVGGVTDVETAADGLTTVLNAYAASGLDVNRISDIMFTTMRNGKTTIGELSQTVGNVATMAAQTGVRFEELGAAVGTLTKSGIDTTKAMDGLRGVLSAVLKQSDQSVKMAEDLGIEFNIAALEAKGLHGFLRDIANTGATSEQLSKLFGRVEGLNVVMSLGAENGAEFTRQLDTMAGAAGATEKAVSKMADQTAFKMNQAKAAFQTIGIEFGERFLASVSGAATAIVKHIDDIAFAVEALVKLLVIRLGITGVAALAAAATSAAGLANAMALLGGPVGALALAFGALLIALDKYQQAQLNSISAVRTNTDLLLKQADAYRAVGDAAGLAANAIAVDEKRKSLIAEITQLEKEIIAIEEKKNKIWNKTTLLQRVLNAELDELQGHLKNARRNLDSYNQESERAEGSTKGLSKGTGILSSAFEDLDANIKLGVKFLKDRATKMNSLDTAQRKAIPAIQNINKLMSESVAILDDLVEEQDEYERSLESLLDTLYPVQAAGEELGDQLAILTRHAKEAGWSTEKYEAAVRSLTDSFTGAQAGARKTAQEFDFMKTAIDEGVRILERTFTNLWSNILDGSKSAFDGIADGFKALMANLIHQATTQQIMINIQQGLQPGGQINFQKLGTDLANFAAVIAGTAIGGGGTGAVVGAALGTAAGTALGSALGWWLGPAGPILGSVLGGALGGLVGGLIDKIFGKNKTPRIGAASFDIKPGDTTFFDTAFGGAFVGDTRGGMDDFVDEFGKGITEFDNAIAAFLDDDQIGAITGALKLWQTELKGDAISLEQLLGSRFATIMTTFSEGIQNFVNQGADLAAQADRLQIGVTAENILGTAPGFEGRTVTDILNVVEAMRTGTQSISDAFNEFVNLLAVVVSVKEALQDFAGSDLGGDFQALLDLSNISLQEAVTGMTSGLMDAINSFDGSPEQLQNIGAMVASVRQGELALLSEIDAIQKGIQANLASLKADLTGLRDGPASDEQLFKDAQGFINAINTASSAEEIAALERQFDAAIRAMSPESQMSNMTSILAMIDNFSSASNTALEGMKQAVIDSGADTRAMVDAFIERIGDPLDIIAGTNRAIAEALTGESGIEGVQAQNEMHEGNMENILETGVSNITGEVANIGPVIRNALSGMNVTVVVQNEDGLVTQ